MGNASTRTKASQWLSVTPQQPLFQCTCRALPLGHWPGGIPRFPQPHCAIQCTGMGQVLVLSPHPLRTQLPAANIKYLSFPSPFPLLHFGGGMHHGGPPGHCDGVTRWMLGSRSVGSLSAPSWPRFDALSPWGSLLSRMCRRAPVSL